MINLVISVFTIVFLLIAAVAVAAAGYFHGENSVFGAALLLSVMFFLFALDLFIHVFRSETRDCD